MAHVALYRKYRSQTFGDVMGQEHVTKTIQNALRSGKITHAYLFCGPRGTGKTTTARLLAKALNCERGITEEPCDECRSCVAIRDGHAVDVVEMDAASETGIDDVRETIIENAQYMPQESRYKVYIVDEVHDLSPKAFDALLKTLEEPPAHVVFVLATTEFHKVPITIRSRCMRFDFRRATLDDLHKRIQSVLDAEGIKADAEAVSLVAQAADGSFRDSLSLLEQVIAFSDGPISAEIARRVLGVVDDVEIGVLIGAIAKQDMAKAVQAVNQMIVNGAMVQSVFDSLCRKIRDITYASAGVFGENASVADQTALKFMANQFTSGKLAGMLEAAVQQQARMKIVRDHRVLLDLLTIRLAAGVEVAPAPAVAPVASEGYSAQSAPPARTSSSVSSAPRPEPAATRRSAPISEPPAAPVPTPAAIPPSPSAVRPKPASSNAVEGGSQMLEVIMRRWQEVLRAVSQQSIGGAKVLQKARPVSCSDSGVLRLEFSDPSSMNLLQAEKRKLFVQQIIASVCGADSIKIECVMGGSSEVDFVSEVARELDGTIED
ncbi:MAG: DNA polymerase III subunit gamma/tau [Armatimonadota bacterium]